MQIRLKRRKNRLITKLAPGSPTHADTNTRADLSVKSRRVAFKDIILWTNISEENEYTDAALTYQMYLLLIYMSDCDI